jgi:hypothetical protein
MIGKPYSGKPNVRFDEGELEIEPLGYYASSLLYLINSRERRKMRYMMCQGGNAECAG